VIVKVGQTMNRSKIGWEKYEKQVGKKAFHYLL